jgi:membrane-associated phospholipid phosphatase
MRQALREHFKPSRALWIRIAVAVVLIAVSALTNRQFLGWGLFVVFAILAVPLGRARSFLYSFVPYALVWFVFTFLRSLADETVLARTLNTNVPRLERWLFGGQLPTVTLQDRFLDLNNLGWHDYFLTGIHWSYFIVPHAVAIRTWQKHPALFRHYLGAMTLTLAVGLLIYFLIPTNPPWLAPEPINSPSAAPVYRVMEAIGKELGGGLYDASYAVIGESNAIAAMPSIHMAITFLVVFPARRAGRRRTLLALVYSGLMGLALVYLGEHYVVDVVVGVVIAIYGWVAAGAWIGRAAPIVFRRVATAPQPELVSEPRT